MTFRRARSFQFSRGPPRPIKATPAGRLSPALTGRVPPCYYDRAARCVGSLFFVFAFGGVSRVACFFWSRSRLSSVRLPLAFRLRLRSVLLFRSFCRRSFPVAFSVRPCLVAFFCRPASFGRRLLCRPSFLPALVCFPSVRSRRLPFSRLLRCSFLRFLPFLFALRRCSSASSFSLAVRAFSSSFRPFFPSLGRFFFARGGLFWGSRRSGRAAARVDGRNWLRKNLTSVRFFKLYKRPRRAHAPHLKLKRSNKLTRGSPPDPPFCPPMRALNAPAPRSNSHYRAILGNNAMHKNKLITARPLDKHCHDRNHPAPRPPPPLF